MKCTADVNFTGVRDVLNKRFPGRGISFRAVEDVVSKCVICQKVRLGMDGYVEPLYRHLKKSH